MKKIMAMFLLLAIVGSFVGCSIENPQGSQDSSTQQCSSTVEQSTQTEDSSNAEDATAGYSREEHLTIGAYVNYKDGVSRYDVAGGKMYVHSRDKVLTSSVMISKDSYEGDLDGVLPLLMEKFENSVRGYMCGTIKGNELKLDSSEKVTVAGFESIRFRGKVYNNIVDCFIYGYTFLVNDQPCMIVGIVSSDSQEQDLIDTVVQDVDAMAKTLRLDD